MLSFSNEMAHCDGSILDIIDNHFEDYNFLQLLDKLPGKLCVGVAIQQLGIYNFNAHIVKKWISCLM